MFYNCTSLVSITGTTAFTKVTDVYVMFYGCESLASIDKFGMLSSTCTSYSTMFSGCTSLSKITFTSASEYKAWYTKLITMNGASLTTAQTLYAGTYSSSPSIKFTA